MSYHVEYSDTALKQLKKMDRFDARLITSWIGKNLEGCSDPRIHGKGLTANRSGERRYRIGSYRALCIIEDDHLGGVWVFRTVCLERVVLSSPGCLWPGRMDDHEEVLEAHA